MVMVKRPLAEEGREGKGKDGTVRKMTALIHSVFFLGKQSLWLILENSGPTI